MNEWEKKSREIFGKRPVIKLWGSIVVLGVIGSLIWICATSCSSYQDDNWFEEKVEELILEETNMDLDLSPKSPEPLKRTRKA
jgi:hypothetical protein